MFDSPWKGFFSLLMKCGCGHALRGLTEGRGDVHKNIRFFISSFRLSGRLVFLVHLVCLIGFVCLVCDTGGLESLPMISIFERTDCFISPLSFLASDLPLVLVFHLLLQVHPQSDLSEQWQFYQALLPNPLSILFFQN